MSQADWLDGEALPVERGELLESEIQESCVAHARAHDCWARKFSSPQNRSVPDYIFCWFGVLWFTEFKRTKKRPTKQQYEEHSKIREAGGIVWVCDDIDDFKARFAELRKIGKALGRPSDYPS